MSVADKSKKLDKKAFVERFGKATACGYAIMVGSADRSVAGHFDGALLRDLFEGGTPWDKKSRGKIFYQSAPTYDSNRARSLSACNARPL